MTVSLKLDGLLSPPLPPGRGAERQDVAASMLRIAKAMKEIRLERPGFIETLDDLDGLEDVRRAAEGLREFRHIAVLGIGGSALGARTIRDALVTGEAREAAPRLHVLDNIDPRSVADAARGLPLEQTLFLAISKSGSTAETIAQLLYFRGRLTEAGVEDWRRHLFLITDPEKGPLRELAEREGIPSLPVPPAVGGRFSVLTPVGLLPAALLGVDPGELVGGAREMREACLAEGDGGPLALERWVACQWLLTERCGARIQVLMSYCDRLRTFGDWFAQLWAESLGKRFSRGGGEVHRGSTPLPAVGATDQHSLVQLFAEGPADKQFLILGLRGRGHLAPIPHDAGEVHPEFAYLGGRSLDELFEAERSGTTQALQAAGRPVGEVIIERLDARHLGALFLFFELATALAGHLYDVDPYDQPGVEAGKILAFWRMGRAGYDERARDILGEAEPTPGDTLTLPPE